MKSQTAREAAKLQYHINRRAEHAKLKEKVLLLRQQGFSLREVADILDRSHEWVRKVEMELSTSKVLTDS